MTRAGPLTEARMERLVEDLRSRPIPAPTTAHLADRTGLTTATALSLLRRLERDRRVMGFETSVNGRLTYKWRLRCE